MWEIVAFQYKISEMFLHYISDNILPYFSEYFPDIIELIPNYFQIFHVQGLLFVTTFILSLTAFWVWRLLWKITWFHAFKPEKYRLVLFLNIFYIVPFIYGFIGWRFNIINVFLMFLWSGAYFAFQYIISHPDVVIDYFLFKGFYM